MSPAIGRVIAPADDQPGAEPVAVVSWSFWQSRFNGDPAVIGQRITIGTTPAVIVGVAPREFFGVNLAARPEIWLPMASETVIQQPSLRANGTLPVALICRLKPGVALDQARAEMRVLDQWRVELFAKTAPNSRALTLEVESAATGLSRLRDRLAKAARSQRTGLKSSISGPFFIGNLAGVGCQLMSLGPRSGTLVGTLRRMPCPPWSRTLDCRVQVHRTRPLLDIARHAVH